jgi:anti-sigma regulatory factor (Ser/Thr protein kinase)
MTPNSMPTADLAVTIPPDVALLRPLRDMARTVIDLSAPDGHQPDEYATLLVVSELATNALEASRRGQGQAITVRVATYPDGVEVAAIDDGPGFPAVSAPSPDIERGRGLGIVRRLCGQFHIDRDDGRTMVVARVPPEPDTES